MAFPLNEEIDTHSLLWDSDTASATYSPLISFKIKALLLALSIFISLACISLLKYALLGFPEAMQFSFSKEVPRNQINLDGIASKSISENSAMRAKTFALSQSLKEDGGAFKKFETNYRTTWNKSYIELVRKHKSSFDRACYSNRKICLKRIRKTAEASHIKTARSMNLPIFEYSNSPWNMSALDSLRTAFHFQPESNWMNDPNAPLYHNGLYHLFFQYNPNNAFWGLISWGHAISSDLVHWLYVELAMQPDQWYDSQGVWTGSATFLEDGTLAVLYTGFTNESVQVQNLAFPADPYDPLLRKWNKYVGNPVLLPPTEVQPTDFRDPTTAWLGADGLWRMCIGSKLEGNGIAILYSTSDFINWKIDNHYLHEVEGTGMWECLDFYPVLKNGSPIGISTSRYGAHVKHVLKASMDDSKLDFYVIGTYDHQSHTFTPDDRSVDLGRGHRYDYGKFYASKSFYDDKGERRILWGWINESDSMQNDIRKGWASVQALPRQVWFDADTESNLIQWPVEEVLDLRRSKYSLENMVLQGGTVVEVTGSSGSQWDIEVTFENPISIGNAEHNISDINQLSFCGEGNASGKGLYGPFGLLVLASEGLEEQTAIYFFFTKSNGTWTTLVCSDQSRSSLAINVDKTSYGSVVPVLKKEKLLSLRVIVDHSIVETFVQGGRVCITSRVYPTLALDNAARLFVFNNGTMPIALKSLDAWKVSKVDMHAYATVQ